MEPSLNFWPQSPPVQPELFAQHIHSRNGHVAIVPDNQNMQVMFSDDHGLNWQYDGTDWGQLKEHTTRIVLPITLNQLIEYDDVKLLESLDITPTWILEYMLCIWARADFQLNQQPPVIDEFFSGVVEDVFDHISECLTPNFTKVQEIFPERSDRLVQICEIIYYKLRPWINALPPPDHGFKLVAANLERVVHNAIYVLLHYDNRAPAALQLTHQQEKQAAIARHHTRVMSEYVHNNARPDFIVAPDGVAISAI